MQCKNPCYEKQPATSNQQPATSNQRPATSNQRPVLDGRNCSIRKKTWLSASLIVSLSATAFLVGCSKEEATGYRTSNDQFGAAITVTQRVQGFVNGAAHLGLVKSTTYLDADSAEWYLEAALNYSLAKAWIEYNDEVVDSLNVTIPMRDAQVSLHDAYAAFNYISNQLNSIGQENIQHIALVDVAARIEGDEFNCAVRYLIGSGYNKRLNTSFPDGYALLWGLNEPSCACGPSTPSGLLCADKIIRQRVWSTILTPMQPGEYWTDVETWFVSPIIDTDIPNHLYDLNDFYEYRGITGHSNQNYPIYLCGDSDCTSCLDADDLSFHTQGTYDVMMWIKNTHCSGKKAITLTVDSEMGLGWGNLYFHYCSFSYGIKHSGNEV